MVPSMNTLGFLIPDCSRVCEAMSGIEDEVDVVGIGAVESGINAEDCCGGRLDVAPGAEDEVGSCPCAGTPKAVAGRGTSPAAEADTFNDVVGGAGRGAAGVGDAESPMIGAIGVGRCTLDAAVAWSGGEDPGVDALSREARIICGCNTL
jgi:hypothetical protein